VHLEAVDSQSVQTEMEGVQMQEELPPLPSFEAVDTQSVETIMEEIHVPAGRSGMLTESQSGRYTIYIYGEANMTVFMMPDIYIIYVIL
jgi:hypothetical protein